MISKFASRHPSASVAGHRSTLYHPIASRSSELAAVSPTKMPATSATEVMNDASSAETISTERARAGWRWMSGANDDGGRRW